MRLEATNTNYTNQRPSFGLKLYKDVGFLMTERLLNKKYSSESVDKFFKSLEYSYIGWDTDAIKMKFFIFSDSGNSHIIRYSFWKKSEVEPTVPYYNTLSPFYWTTLHNDLTKLKGKILKDLERFISGADDEMIQIEEYKSFMRKIEKFDLEAKQRKISD